MPYTLKYHKLDILYFVKVLKTFKKIHIQSSLLQMPYTLKYLKLDLLHLMKVLKTFKKLTYDLLYFKCLIILNHLNKIFYISREFGQILQIRSSSPQMSYTLKLFK